MNERDIIEIKPKPMGRDIAEQVAKRHGLTFADFYGRSRKRVIAWPRQEAMWEVKQKTLLSYPQIGRLFGGRDHCTVFRGCERHEARRALARAA